jgi:predicted nucleotidyltransferase
MSMKLDEFEGRLAVSALMVMGKGHKTSDVDVLITKSSGETLFCCMKDSEVIDYFKVD